MKTMSLARARSRKLHHQGCGRITEGMDVCIAISKVPTNNDNPSTPIMMKSITIAGA